MNDLVQKMNVVFEEWKKTFDPQGAVQLTASAGEDNQLYINDRPLFAPDSFKLTSAQSSIDRLNFFFDNGRSVAVCMMWPEDGTPYVDGFSFGFYGTNPGKAESI